MKCSILHETPGRMRVHLALRRMSLREADLLEYDLKGVAGVVSVKVFDRTQDAVITYTCPRADIVRALSSCRSIRPVRSTASMRTSLFLLSAAARSRGCFCRFRCGQRSHCSARLNISAQD